jgi:hypothetical protein
MGEYTKTYDPLLSTGKYKEIQTFPDGKIFANQNN